MSGCELTVKNSMSHLRHQNMLLRTLHWSFLGNQKRLIYIIATKNTLKFFLALYFYSLKTPTVHSLRTSERLHLWKQTVFSSSMYQRQTASSGSLLNRLLSTRSAFQDSAHGSVLSSMQCKISLSCGEEICAPLCQ